MAKKKGVNMIHLEKYLLSFLAFVGCLVIFYKYLAQDTVSSELDFFVLGIIGFLVTRKGLSYFKSNDYYTNNGITPDPDNGSLNEKGGQ